MQEQAEEEKQMEEMLKSVASNSINYDNFNLIDIAQNLEKIKTILAEYMEKCLKSDSIKKDISLLMFIEEQFSNFRSILTLKEKEIRLRIKFLNQILKRSKR